MKAHCFGRVLQLRFSVPFAIALFLVSCSMPSQLTPSPEIPNTECPESNPPVCPQADCPKCPQLESQKVVDLQLPHYEQLWSISKHNPTVPCKSCHNENSTVTSNILIPSGLDILMDWSEAHCLRCHLGQSTTPAVEEAIAKSGQTDKDTPNESLEFIGDQNFAAATKLGSWAMGGYQYPEKSYDAMYTHVEDYDSCADCHDPHTLELKLGGCIKCHPGVDAEDDFERIRGEVSKVDYDGDCNFDEGISLEIEGYQKILYQAIQTYTRNGEQTILYDRNTPPYYFIDIDENGELDATEAIASNGYKAWTPRLLKAAYNYHFSMQDPGAFVHNGKFVIQLLYDSIEDLDESLVEKLTRDDPGHFDGSGEAWRHWDDTGEVPRDCARCHSATGLPTYIAVERDYPQSIANGMSCTTCHTNLIRYQRYDINDVKFPSEATLTIDTDSNLCLNCHQGRSSGANVDSIADGLDPDTVVESLSLPDIHYYPAGATFFGSEAWGAYQYSGQRYIERNPHVFDFSTCINCHSGHGLEVDEEQCATCHGRRASDERTKPQHHPSPMACRDCHGMVEVEKIRGHKDYTVPEDHDGDGDVREGLSAEVATLEDVLYFAIQDYGREVVGIPIVFDSKAYPYYFQDLNDNGEADVSETTADNCYSTWTPRLLKAAYNYQYSVMDPGAYAHNGQYILQILYDTLKDIGGDTSGMIRP